VEHKTDFQLSKGQITLAIAEWIAIERTVHLDMMQQPLTATG